MGCEMTILAKAAITVSAKEDGYSFGGKIWTQASSPMDWRDCARYCLARGTMLQTLDDAIEARVMFDGKNSSSAYQFTSTLIATLRDGIDVRAFVYEPADLEELMKHADFIRNMPLVFLSKTSPLGKRFLSGREFVPKQHVQIMLDDYRKNSAAIALMPKQAATNARYLQKKGHAYGEISIKYEQ